MKIKRILPFLLVSGFLLVSCAGNQASTVADNTKTEKKKKGKDFSSYSDLASILRRYAYAGVEVTGTGENASVRIRCMNSLMGDTRPLYVIDGAIVGRDYRQANAAINPADVASVRIVKDLAQLAKYGEQGRNGVIIIKTRSHLSK